MGVSVEEHFLWRAATMWLTGTRAPNPPQWSSSDLAPIGHATPLPRPDRIGVTAGSASLQADARDFFGDTASFAISLSVAGLALTWRARAAAIQAGP